jgi:hypothetical protein
MFKNPSCVTLSEAKGLVHVEKSGILCGACPVRNTIQILRCAQNDETFYRLSNAGRE